MRTQKCFEADSVFLRNLNFTTTLRARKVMCHERCLGATSSKMTEVIVNTPGYQAVLAIFRRDLENNLNNYP